MAADRLLPGLHAAAPAFEEARRCAIAAVRAHHTAEPLIAMMFGSYARRCPRRLSDLDLIVVPVGLSVCSKATFVREGMPFEIASYSLEALRGLLAQSAKAGALDLPHVVATSDLLIGETALHDELITAARQAMAMPGPELSTDAKRQMRWRATSMLLKLIASDDRHEQAMLGGRLVQLLAFLLLRFDTGWSFSRPDHALTALRDHDASTAEALSCAYAALIDGDGVEHLVTAAEDALQRLGGACWDGVIEPVAGPIRGVPG